MTNILHCQQLNSNLLHSNAYLYFKSLKHAKRRVAEKLMELFQNYPTVYISTQKLADMLGISRCYCSTLLNLLEDDGVFVIKRRWNNSNIYRLTSFMLRRDVLEAASRGMAIISNFLDTTFKPFVKKLTLSISTLFVKKTKTRLSTDDVVERNDFFTIKQEKIERRLIWFQKGEGGTWGYEDQTDFYRELGYERRE